MAFVYEIVPEEDYDFFRSMKLKNFGGNGNFSFSPGTTSWSADREKNAFLVNVGGGHADVPHFHDLWWNETVIRIETAGGGKGNYEIGVDIFWFVKQIPIPEKIWKDKDEIVKMISEALSVDPDWCGIEYLKSINVALKCEPIMTKE